MTKTPLSTNLRKTYLQEFKEQVNQHKESLIPASTETIQKMLATVAITLNIDIPSDEALRAYITLLKKYPDDLIQKSGVKVMETHKWPRFPFPADFVQHIKQEHNEREYWHRWYKNQLATMREPVIRPLSDARANSGPRKISTLINKIEKK